MDTKLTFSGGRKVRIVSSTRENFISISIDKNYFHCFQLSIIPSCKIAQSWADQKQIKS